MLGRTENELAGKEFSSLFPDDRHYREVIGIISRNRGSGGWGSARCSLVRNSGEVMECTIRMRRLNPMNAEKGYIVVIEDDHEKRFLEWAVGEYQEKMAKNEMKYLEILQKMDQVLIKTDPNGTITFWNTRAEAAFGYKAGEVKGKNIVAVTTDTGSRSAKDMAVLMYRPRPFQSERRTANPREQEKERRTPLGCLEHPRLPGCIRKNGWHRMDRTGYQ